jgi:RNA polymerase primary sigma factor
VERLTATKTNTRPQKEELPQKEGPGIPPNPPLLDLPDAAVTKLIRSAKKRGYVTHDQINSVLPFEEVNSEQIRRSGELCVPKSDSAILVVKSTEDRP